jgi:predicted metalloprotease with PDZ domain
MALRIDRVLARVILGTLLSVMTGLPGLAVAAPRAGATVAYTLSPHIDRNRLDGLAVTIRLRADASGITRIGWESNWAGQTRLWQWARDFRVAGAVETVSEGNGRWRIRSAPRAALTIRYRLVAAADKDPASDSIAEPDPIVRPTWFYTVGESLFAYPIDRADAPATFAWRGAPKGFGFASDLQHMALRRGSTVEDILESVSIGGWPLHVAGAMNKQGGVRIATIGDFAFRRADFDSTLKRIIEAERGFWKDDSGAPMLVTAIALRHASGHTSSAGTGRDDAFAMWIDETSSLDGIIWLLGHEYFHHWNPAQLGALPKDEVAEYWLSEGFTDYYARALLLRAGIVTNEQFAGQWNHMLNRYARSSDNRISNQDLAARYYNDGSLHDLPYQRGAMLAALWNRRLRAASKGRYGLDDVLRSMKSAPARAAGRDLVDTFTAAAGRFGLGVQDDIRRYITSGDPLTLPADVFGPCAAVAATAVPDFDLGFDYAATQRAANRITGVRPTSSAYAAGLREGMTLLALLSGDSSDASVPIILRVSDAGVIRTVRYQPSGTATSDALQLRLTGKGSECASSLSGE